ncbi:MAG: hypothetical protein IJ411_04495 [Oscillospiraceae bacterium]|nr:hypothetical protein [Oscillospiraceae bacterium]
MNVLLWCITGFLLVLGLAQLWEVILLRWYCPKLPLLRYELIPLSGSVENMEQLLRYVELSSAGTVVLFVDRGLDYASRELCRHFCQQSEGMLLLTEQEVQAMIFAQNDLEPVENP